MDGIIFDVDGTLWDSRIPVAHAWNATLERLTGKSWDYDPEYLGRLFGKSMDVIQAILLPGYPPEEQQRIGTQCYLDENEWLRHEPGTLYPGVEETLAALSRRLPCYIVSNCQSGYIEVMLETTGLGKYFSGHLCFGDTGTAKGQTLRILCRRYGLQEAVYVGDTQGDADACEEAGIPMIFAEYGLGEVKSPGTVIQTFSQLLELV